MPYCLLGERGKYRSLGISGCRLLRPEIKKHWEVIAFCGLSRDLQRGWKTEKISFMETRKIIATSKNRGGGRSYSEASGTESHNHLRKQKETSVVIEMPCRWNAFYLWQVKVMLNGALHP